MSHYKIGFLWIAVAIFLLPVLINITYAIFPPANADRNTQPKNKALEWIEQFARIVYFMSAALWLHNYIACGFMVIFGTAHIVSTAAEFRSFHKD